MPITFREIVKILKKDGWYQVGQSGSHVQFKHPSKPGRVTVPKHGGRTIAPGTEKSIYEQAGINKK